MTAICFRSLVHLKLFIFTLLVLLTVTACSCPPPARVTRLVAFEQKIYAGYIADGGQQSTGAVYSLDGGKTWEYIDPDVIPNAVIRELTTPVELPMTACDPTDAQICYRIIGQNYVEGSSDGGKTWQIVWQVPWGRTAYMQTYVDRIPDCKFRLDLIPFDLAFLTQGNTSTLVVAMGTEGVLIKTHEGVWERHGVAWAEPTPYTANDFQTLVFVLLYEIVIFLLMAVITWWGVSSWGWTIFLKKLSHPPEHSAWWVVKPITYVSLLIFLACFLPYLVIENVNIIPVAFELAIVAGPIISILIVGILIWIGPILVWHRLRKISSQPNMVHRVAWTCGLMAMGMFLACLPFAWWAFGLIPVYEIALILSVLIAIFIIFLGCRHIRQLTKLMFETAETNS